MEIVTFCLVAIATAVADDIAVQELTNSNNLFASAIYKAVYKSTAKNFILSPLSAVTALSFLKSGCKGDSAEELRKVLFLSNDNQEVQQGFKTLLPSLTGNGFYTMHMAKKIYVTINFTIRPNFRKMGKQVYQAGAELIRFNQRKKAANAMNKWVQKNTRNKIRNIIEPSALNGTTRVVLLDAFYFRANWSNPFVQTRKSQFYKTATDTVTVDSMHQTGGTYNFFENNELNAKFLELPFKGNESSLVVVLPNARDGLGGLENRMDKVLEPQQFSKEVVTLDLPKWKVETRVHLKNILKALGVVEIFEKKIADLSLVGGKKGALFVSDALQKISMSVSEGGVEVAGSTGSGNSASFGPNLAAKEFIADHPFIYILKLKNVIACVGRVVDPTQ